MLSKYGVQMPKQIADINKLVQEYDNANIEKPLNINSTKYKIEEVIHQYKDLVPSKCYNEEGILYSAKNKVDAMATLLFDIIPYVKEHTLSQMFPDKEVKYQDEVAEEKKEENKESITCYTSDTVKTVNEGLSTSFSEEKMNNDIQSFDNKPIPEKEVKSVEEYKKEHPQECAEIIERDKIINDKLNLMIEILVSLKEIEQTNQKRIELLEAQLNKSNAKRASKAKSEEGKEETTEPKKRGRKSTKDKAEAEAEAPVTEVKADEQKETEEPEKDEQFPELC
jgi:hypothetical protein